MHMETSARTGENVEESFLKCARAILTKIESGKRALVCALQCLSLCETQEHHFPFPT